MFDENASLFIALRIFLFSGPSPINLRSKDPPVFLYDSKAFKKLLLKSENAPNQMNNYIDLLYSNYER